DSPMSYVVLKKLPYLTAYIKEALRFSIGVVHPLPRMTGSTTMEIVGHKIPPSMIIKISILLMHVNPNVFHNPYTFNPD
ncbi:cytochrome P450, partial [Lentinula edodes]